jgi:hypothetical protein
MIGLLVWASVGILAVLVGAVVRLAEGVPPALWAQELLIRVGVSRMMAIVAIALLALQVVLLWKVYGLILGLRGELRAWKRLAKRARRGPDRASVDAGSSEMNVPATLATWRSWREGGEPSDQFKSTTPPA